MSWDYRIIKEDDRYHIAEVHCHDDGTPRLYTGPISVVSYSDYENQIEAIKWTLERMLVATTEPVLTPEDFLRKS